MKARKYAKDDRYIRRKSENLVCLHNNYSDIPVALDEWQKTWITRGSDHTATLKDEMLAVSEYLAKVGKLKTFSLYDNDKLAAFANCVIDGNIAYNTFISVWDEYRPIYAGMRVILEEMAWACESGMQNLDLLRTSSLPKHKWAEPEVKGFRLIRCPLGLEILGSALSTLKDISHDIRSIKSNRLKSAIKGERQIMGKDYLKAS
jgi:CelD/BcsL family acetyltransferase involved in cellulose biosynthesis